MNGFNIDESLLLQQYRQAKDLQIERLLTQYGTSLKDVREMYPQLTGAIKQRQLTTAFPTQPLFFTASDAAEMGLGIGEGWMLKMSPVNGGFTSSFITPEKWEITENDLYISPEGTQYPKADIEALLSMPAGVAEGLPSYKPLALEDLTEEGQTLYQEYQGAGGELGVSGWIDLRERQQLETEQIFGAVFPEQDISEVIDYISTDPEGFLADIREIGPTEEVVALLKSLEFPDEEGNTVHLTDEEIQGFFGTVEEVEVGGVGVVAQFPALPFEVSPAVWATKTTPLYGPLAREAQDYWQSLTEIQNEGLKVLGGIDTVPITLTTKDGEEIELIYNPSDSTVWKDERQVGTIDRDTGDFIPREPSVGRKILGGILTGLSYLFYPFTGFGMLIWSTLQKGDVIRDLEERAEKGEDVSQHWQELTGVSGKYTAPSPLQVELMRESGEFEDIDKLTPGKEWLPGGEVYKDYRRLPWYQQLLYELPAWALLAVAGGATGLSKILEASAAKSGGAIGVAYKGTMAILRPIVAVETGAGNAVKVIINRVPPLKRLLIDKPLEKSIRAYLTKQGVTNPTKAQINIYKEMIAQAPAVRTTALLQTEEMNILAQTYGNQAVGRFYMGGRRMSEDVLKHIIAHAKSVGNKDLQRAAERFLSQWRASITADAQAELMRGDLFIKWFSELETGGITVTDEIISRLGSMAASEVEAYFPAMYHASLALEGQPATQALLIGSLRKLFNIPVPDITANVIVSIWGKGVLPLSATLITQLINLGVPEATVKKMSAEEAWAALFRQTLPGVPSEVTMAEGETVSEGLLYREDLAILEATKPGERVDFSMINEAGLAKARTRLEGFVDGQVIEDVDGRRWIYSLNKRGIDNFNTVFTTENGRGIVGAASNKGLNLVARSKNVGSITPPAVKPTPEVEAELRGLNVIIANLQEQQAKGLLLDAGAKAQLESALARQAELTEVTEVAETIETKTRHQLEGLGKMYREWWSKRRTAAETKDALARYVRENLPLNVRGKFLTAVAKVKTDAQLQTQMDKVNEFAEQNAQKTLKIEIHQELKKARAKIKEHILKGKFTPEVQRRLDTLIQNLEADRDIAREKIAENIIAYEEGKLGYEEMLISNKTLNFAGIEGMSAEELANTLEYIKALETTGRSGRQAKQEAATEIINAIRSDISNTLTGGEGLKTGIGAIPTGELVAKTGWWDTFTNWQYGIDNLADKLSKLDPTSKPYQSALSEFVAQVHRATIEQISGTRNAYAKVKDIIKEVYGVKSNRDINQILNALDEETNLGVFELTEEYKAIHPGATTITLKMTRNQMIAKYMQMQDPTLNDTFTTGMGWSQNVKDAITNNLSIEEKKLADALFSFYEDYYTATNKIYQELFNVDMPHNPVYSPIRRDFEADVIENVLTLRDASQFASVLNGSLKARQRNTRPLRFNGALDILSNHIQQMEHFKAWATTMRDMRRVFGNKEIRQAIEQYHGKGVLRLIDTFLNQMARGGIETAATNRGADYLRRNFTKAILAIKPVIMLKQIPSLFGYISEMSVPEFFGGIADFWTSPIANFKFLYSNSKMFRARIEQGFERDIRAAMEKHGKKLISGQGKLTDWFLLQIRLGDTFAVTQGMWAKYKAGLKQGLTQEEAIAAAEDTTGRTQPSFGIDTLSAIQNGGSFLKLLTMFQNQPNKYFRMVGDNIRNFKYGRGSRAKAASTILLAWVILPMMFQFIADAFQWKPERQARAGILGPLNFVLIGGQLVQSMWGWLTDQPFDYQISPVAQTGRDLQMIFTKAKKLIAQGQDPYKDIQVEDIAALVEYLAKAVGQVTGLPTPYFVQLERLLRHKFEEGEEIGIKDFLFSEWALEPPAKNAEEKVEDISLQLGEVKEGQEDVPLSEQELKYYTTVDWFRDIGNIYSKTLPQDVLKDIKTSKESKLWAQYELARANADILPNTPLYKINTDDNEDTIINYYQQWNARQRITSLAELREFDKLYPKAYLGNVTRQQYELLKQYLEVEDKDAFLEDHPELRINPRDEWLEKNPVDNAMLAIGGQAKILTHEAYNELKKLIKEFDIPDNAIPDFTLPPKGSVENYFKYGELGKEYGYNSAEVKLLLAEDNALREWLGRQEIETPIKLLRLQVEYRDSFEQYDAFGDEDSPQYISDDDQRAEARRRLLFDDQTMTSFGKAYYTKEASSQGYSESNWNAYVEYSTLPIWGSWRERFLLDNPDFYNEYTSIGNHPLVDQTKVRPVARDKIYQQFYDEFQSWDETGGMAPKAIDNMRAELDTIERGGTTFKEARYSVQAYDKGFPEGLIDDYVGWYSVERKDYEDDWWLMEHPEFYKKMYELDIWTEPRDFSKVPTREVYALYQTYQSLPSGTPRYDFRRKHPDLDAWLVLKFGYKPITDRGNAEAPPTPWEEQQDVERFKDLFK